MFRLPLLFIVTGIVGFTAFQIASLSSFSGWLGEELRGPNGWFHAHLYVLGWATMLAMGAVYQLISVILQSKLYSRRLGYIHYALFVAGLSGLLYGFARGDIHWIASCASLAFVGILLFVWNMAVTLRRAAQWNPVTISAACALLYLTLTGFTGMALGLNFAAGLFGNAHEKLFGAHIWLGTVGWFGLLITGFSYKMLPMFFLAHHFPTRLQTVVLLLWNGAVLGGALSFLLGGVWFKWGALFLLTAAVIVYNVHLLQIRRSRHKRNPGFGIKWSMYASQTFAFLLVVMLVYAFVYPERWLQAGAVLVGGWIYLVGWVSFTILSYASKIVPFLWWTHKYGSRAGKPGTPVMADLLDEKKANAVLTAIAVLTLLLAAGLAIESPTMIEVAGTALSLCSIAYISLIALVFSR